MTKSHIGSIITPGRHSIPTYSDSQCKPSLSPQYYTVQGADVTVRPCIESGSSWWRELCAVFCIDLNKPGEKREGGLATGRQKQALYRHIFILIVANFYRYCKIMHANTWQHINPGLCVV